MTRAEYSRLVPLGLALALVSCANDGNKLTVEYDLSALAVGGVDRVETDVAIDDSNGETRTLSENATGGSIGNGVSYRIFTDSDTGERSLFIVHDAKGGFAFRELFRLAIAPPPGESPPRIRLTARALTNDSVVGVAESIRSAFTPGRVTTLLFAQRCQGASACASGQTCCGDGCFNLDSDRAHCGECDSVCNPGEQCIGGTCKCGAEPSCAGDSALCCVDAQGNGSCAQNGACVCGSISCGFPNQCCPGDQCVSRLTDPANCGACGNVCERGMACVDGVCRCGQSGTTCTGSDECCGDDCVQLLTSANCGGCNAACPKYERCDAPFVCSCSGATCTMGQACCEESLVSIDPISTGGLLASYHCIDILSDDLNCGECGHNCNDDKNGKHCVNGACVQ